MLGPQAGFLAGQLATMLRGPEAVEACAQLFKVKDVPEELPECILETLNQQPRRVSARFVDELRFLLEQRVEQPLTGKPSHLESSLARFKRLFDLTDDELELCLVFYFMRAHQRMAYFLDDQLEMDRLTGRDRLRTALGATHTQLERLFNGKLSRIGILSQGGFNRELSDEFLPFLLDPDTETAPDHLYARVPDETLPLDHHEIDAKVIEQLSALLGRRQASPTHVLLYGTAGTGKTSFARALCKQLGVKAYEITKDAREGRGNSVRSALLCCLNITNGAEGSVVIVDEADHVLNTRLSWLVRGENQDKGWLNQLMEEPGVRMIWITNSIEGMEESTLRRFAFSLAFKPFNRRQRARLWERVLRRNRIKRHFSAQDIEALALEHGVNAGEMDMAARKAAECGGGRSQVQQALHLALDANRTLRHGGHRPRKEQYRPAEQYSLEGLNIEGDLDGFMQRMRGFDAFLRDATGRLDRGMNVLFHGPPGTGKSELARYLAHKLDRELVVKRASDLMNPYVGMTERFIAEAFEEAEREEAVLVLDEADTLLFSRESAVHSWEVSQTNELLTQMEAYRGILICTTNRLTSLDSASVRRFHEKLGFDYLTPEGNLLFYARLLQPIAGKELTAKQRRLLEDIKILTPGDFNLVRGKYALGRPGDVDNQALLDALAMEAKIKSQQAGTESQIGF